MVRSAGTLPWLGFDRVQPNRQFSRGSIVKSMYRMCCIDRLSWPKLPGTWSRRVRELLFQGIIDYGLRREWNSLGSISTWYTNFPSGFMPLDRTQPENTMLLNGDPDTSTGTCTKTSSREETSSWTGLLMIIRWGETLKVSPSCSRVSFPKAEPKKELGLSQFAIRHKLYLVVLAAVGWALAIIHRRKCVVVAPKQFRECPRATTAQART
jgi:hypothetical protein